MLPLLLLLALPLSASAITRTLHWDVHRLVAAPDGVARPLIAINQRFPPAPVHLARGDTLVLRVRNHLERPTAIHAHGLFHRRTPWWDGTAGIAQCPIPPRDELVYHIHTGDQAGTTWLHAHYKAEYMDGLAVPLIIHDPDDPHRHLYDDEHVVTLSDWYHDASDALMDWYLSPASHGDEPLPDSGLINGQGRFDCRFAAPGQPCRPNAPRASFNFVPGKRYRLRIINMSAFAAFTFSIDGHALTVIEADMVNVRPHTVDRIHINVAQRYAVVVEAKAPVGNYWMRATMATACFPGPAPKLDRNVVARVHYHGAPDAEPLAPAALKGPAPSTDPDAPECRDLDPSLLTPLHARPVTRPTHVIRLDAAFAEDARGVKRAQFNHVSHSFDFSRSMLQDLATGALTTFPTARNVYPVPLGAEVRVVITVVDDGEHPIHLHGFEFQVLAVGKGEYHPDTPLHLNNPPRRDTFTIPANGYGVIQFTANNVGIWPLHCHIEAHAMGGMFANIQVGSPRDFQRLHIPASLQRLCGARPGSLPPLLAAPVGPAGALADRANRRLSREMAAGLLSGLDAAHDRSHGSAHVDLVRGQAVLPAVTSWASPTDTYLS